MSDLQKQFLEEIEQMFWFNLTNSEKNVEFDFGQYKLNRLYKPFINLYSKEFFNALESDIINDKEKQKVVDTFIDFFSLYYNNWDFGYFKSKFNNYQYRVNYSWKDTEFFWATKDCYYVKTSDVVNEIELNAINSQTWINFNEIQDEEIKLKFTKKVKSSNEKNDKFDFEIEIKDLFSEVEDEEEIKIGYEIVFYNWEESKITKPTKLKQIKEELKKHNIDYDNNSWLQNALDNFLKKWWRDYFIHKRLKEFLSEELEWYFFQVLKDDIQNKVAILEIQNQINTLKEKYSDDKEYLDFQIAKLLKESNWDEKNLNIYTFSYAWILNFINIISDLEELKKSLWTKKRKVIREDFCITLWKLDEHIKVDRKEFFESIAKNENQILEWKELLSNDLKHLKDINIDWIINDLKFQNFEKTKNIVVDTKHFDRKSEVYKRISWMWKQELFEDNAKLDWILIKSENFQALNTLQDKYAWKISTIYIDPLYNTWSDGFIYKDWYSHWTWSSMLKDRLDLSLKYLNIWWDFFSSIWNHESWNLNQLLNLVFWEENFIEKLIYFSWNMMNLWWLNSKDFFEQKDYIYHYSNWQNNRTFNKLFKVKLKYLYGLEKRHWIDNPFTKAFVNNLLKKEYIKYFKDANFSWYTCDLIWKVENSKIVKLYIEIWDEEQKNRINIDLFEDIITEKREWFDDDRKYFVEIIGDLFDEIYSFKYRPIIMSESTWFNSWQKPEKLIKRIILSSSNFQDIILDYFLWSWTTTSVSHKMGRKYLWFEMWEHFENIILPRMKKILWWDNSWISFQENYNWWWFFKYLYLNQYDDWFSDNGYLKNLESEINALESLKIEENKISDLVFRLKDLKEKIYNGDENL